MRLFLLGLLLALTTAQSNPIPCSERPTARYEPWIESGIACLEQVTPAHGNSALAYFALVAAPDGSLYGVRPFAGELVHLTDADGDGLPESARVIADGLTMPAGIWLEDDALYIVGGANIYRYAEGAIRLLVDDVTLGDHWNSAITLDAGDPLTQAESLAELTAFAWLDDALYATDAATDALYRIDGDSATRIVSLPAGARPASLTAYRGAAIPALRDHLLVVLRGSDDPLDLGGYLVVAADPQAGTWTPLMPARPDRDAHSDFTLDEMNYRGSGFFPQRPLAVAVNADGWVYISLSDGRLLALRP